MLPCDYYVDLDAFLAKGGVENKQLSLPVDEWPVVTSKVEASTEYHLPGVS